MSKAITEDDWAEWAKEEIIALHENIKQRDAKIAELEKLLLESEQTGNFLPNDKAEERGARRLAEYLVHKSEYPCSSVEDLMQLWREGRGK